VIQVDAEGFWTGIGDQTPAEYFRDPCPVPSLSAHTAMRLLECPEDVYRTHPRLGGKARDGRTTAALENGKLIDLLITGVKYAPGERREHSAISKAGKPLKAATYERTDSMLIVDAEKWSSNSAKELKAMARAEGLLPVLRDDLEEQIERVPEYIARLELVGVSLERVRMQVPVFWVEEAPSSGAKVQCRALLDMLDEDGGLITDLKTAADLSPKGIARSMFQYKYNVQGAAYRRGTFKALPGDAAPPEFRLAFLRTEMPAARAVPLRAEWLLFGELLWDRAIDIWAECMSTGFWPGHESDATEILMEPYMQTDVKRQLGVEE
jgi:hypothetical protein